MKRPKPAPEAISESPPRLIGYARVSTAAQSLQMQLDAFERLGILPENIHTDVMSGGATSGRKGLQRAWRDMREGDTFVVWRLDRMGRSARDLLNRLEEMDKAGVRFMSFTEAIDTRTVTGRLTAHLMAAFAEFERNLIRDRTKSGMAAAKAQGKVLGRKPDMTPGKIEQAGRMLSRGMGAQAVGAKLGVSHTTILNYFKGGRSAAGLKKYRSK